MSSRFQTAFEFHLCRYIKEEHRRMVRELHGSFHPVWAVQVDPRFTPG